MSSARKLLPLGTLCARQFSQTAVKRAEQVTEVPSAQFKKLKEKQKKFQVEDGLPVYLKGGFLDKILFQFTCATTTIGVLLGLQVFLKLAQKS